MTIEMAPALLTGYLLALIRAAAWVFVSPPFGSRAIPMTVKIGLAGALTLAIGPKLSAQAVPLEVGPLISAAVLQVVAGLALGFLAVLLFSVFSAAGGLIDMFSGFSAAQVIDPGSMHSNTVFGSFYSVLATTLLFAIDGHLLLVRGFLTSFEAAPFTSLSMRTMTQFLTQDIGRFLIAALEIAAPLLAALFLADAALGLLSRAAPALNVFVLGLPLKIMLTLGLAGVAIPLLPDAVNSMVEPAVRQGLRLFGG
jgi:flagellar biosynthetic protein FliR